MYTYEELTEIYEEASSVPRPSYRRIVDELHDELLRFIALRAADLRRFGNRLAAGNLKSIGK